MKKYETAIDESEKEEKNKKIVTFIEGIDVQLGGGIPLGRVTEICELFSSNSFLKFENQKQKKQKRWSSRNRKNSILSSTRSECPHSK